MALLAVLALCSPAVAVAYRAAAVEFAPLRAAGQTATPEVAHALKLQNLDLLAGFARSAKAAGAQIIVFPEYGITGDGLQQSDFNRSNVIPFAEELSPWTLAATPCDFPDQEAAAPAVTKASCLARELQIVLVLDLLTRENCSADRNGCPSNGQLIHNTAVALDETGSLLSIYHKRHPFGDEHGFVDASDTEAKARFTTRFGVTFGMFICFDLMFELSDPDVSDIVFPTDWVNNVLGPFGPGAREAQSAWSLAHGKNLIAANYGGFGRHSSGSGIYERGKALASFFNPSTEPRSHLLIADLPGGNSTPVPIDGETLLV